LARQFSSPPANSAAFLVHDFLLADSTKCRQIVQLLRAGSAFAVADFKFVPVGIFKKDGVITRAVFDTEFGAFDIFATGFANNLGNLIHGGAARCPEGDAVSVGLMIGLFRESEKIDCFGAFRLEQSPALSAFVDVKANGTEDLGIKALRGFPIPYPKIDVVE
jgi:hypothetical protein